MATLQELREKYNYTPPSGSEVTSQPHTLSQLRRSHDVSVVDYINTSRQQGMSDEQILREVEWANPNWSENIAIARSRGAGATMIIDDILAKKSAISTAVAQSGQENELKQNSITFGIVTITILTLFFIAYFVTKKHRTKRLSSFVAWRLFTVVYGLIATFVTGLVVILFWSGSNQSVYMSAAIATLLALESFLIVVTIYRFTAILVNYVIYGNGENAMAK